MSNEPNCTGYLNKAPIGGMKLVIQEYRDVLEARRRPAEIAVQPNIQWGKISWDGTTQYSVEWSLYVNGDRKAFVTDRRVKELSELPNKLSERVTINANTFDDTIAIKLVITELDNFGDNDNIGFLEEKVTPQQMLNERKFRVTGDSGDRVLTANPHWLWFSGLQGYRQLPQLPPWHP